MIKLTRISTAYPKAAKNINYSKNKSFLVEINTKLSNNYIDINEKYLIKLGSYGLFNRLNIIKNLDKEFD